MPVVLDARARKACDQRDRPQTALKAAAFASGSTQAGGRSGMERWGGRCPDGASGQLRLRPEPPGGRSSRDLVQLPQLVAGAVSAGEQTPAPAGPAEARHRPTSGRTKTARTRT